MPNAQPLLQVQDLSIAFQTESGLVNPVERVSFNVYPGQTLALVGESGCGKSISAMSILRLLPSPPTEYPDGKIFFDGEDLLSAGEKRMQRIRGGQIAMIFQEPMTCLNPVYTIGEQISEAITLHQHVTSRRAVDIAAQALKDVGIADAPQRLNEYPHQMSGGMRQRVMIAMALACKPRLLIADEPTTALDVTIQAQILELLRELQTQTNMAMLLITHDLGVVAENADAVAVMYAGRIAEYAKVEDLFDHPTHPYTAGLLASIPRLNSQATRLNTIPGVVPAPRQFPPGCRFHPRCDQMQNDPVCKTIVPTLRELPGQHWCACHHAPGYAQAPATQATLAGKRAVIPADGSA